MYICVVLAAKIGGIWWHLLPYFTFFGNKPASVFGWKRSEACISFIGIGSDAFSHRLVQFGYLYIQLFGFLVICQTF